MVFNKKHISSEVIYNLKSESLEEQQSINPKGKTFCSYTFSGKKNKTENWYV